MTGAPDLAGGCLCGAVRYAIADAPRLVSHCHCSLCRRASGAAFVTWLTVLAERFAVTRGELSRYRSSDHGWRSFCPTCGTQILSGSQHYPRYVEVTAGSLAEPERITPERHVFWPDHLAWVGAADGLPRHRGDARSPLVDEQGGGA
jgi:hypothetical protein